VRAALGAAVLLAAAACGPTSSADDGGDDDNSLDGRVDARPVSTDGDGGVIGDECNTLRLTLRDFTPSTHPDFESDTDSDFAYPGLVRDTLGSDGKPVYAPAGATPHSTGPAQFAQWYRDTPGINMTFSVPLPLTETTPGHYAYDSAFFFPLDGRGYGNEGLDVNGQLHNFHFTTEIHTTFRYGGGEVFHFMGDDDLWLFINQKLAIDLGGFHPSLPGSVDLDAAASELGLTVGQTYAMDIFHAERHTDASNFHIETTIDCFIVP
jgi:fibro-slime domain-containing protein